MNLLNQPLSWNPNLYGWKSNQNKNGMGSSQAFGSAQAFGSPLREPKVVSDTQPKVEKKKACNRGMMKRSTS
ncbi:hypothetical protein Hanom_Chr04g00312051 [Helianthus anomalus]